MATVLVPLDETALAETILPDAERLAGPGGRIVLVYVAGRGQQVADIERYLSNEAEQLQARRFQTEYKVLTNGNVPRAIDEGVTEFGADFVAVATSGASRGGRLARSSAAWKALAHSPVPILMRHAEVVRDLDEPAPAPVIIMVPLDGSANAEMALPVAAKLATQWHGSLLLAHIGEDQVADQSLLDRAAATLSVPVRKVLGQGSAAEALAHIAREQGVTHVVMTSHGRTGLARVLAGDVAAQLIDRLPLPIVVVQCLAEPSA